MKTLITLIAAACLVGTAFGQQPNPSPTPGPEHKKLEIWVGDWTYEIVAQASPLGPASTFTGKNTARPILQRLKRHVHAAHWRSTRQHRSRENDQRHERDFRLLAQLAQQFLRFHFVSY